MTFYLGFLMGTICSVSLCYLGYMMAKITLKEVVDIPSIIPNTLFKGSRAYTTGKKTPKVNDDDAYLKREKQGKGDIPYGG